MPSNNWPDLSSATGVPPIVTPESPGFIVVPAIAIAVGAAVMAWPAMVVRMRCGTWAGASIPELGPCEVPAGVVASGSVI